jgi:hypothetical protein
LDEVAKSVPGRAIGVNCLPAPLVMMQGLNDIRGYDPFDPARMVTLLKKVAVPGEEYPYAAVMYLLPKGRFSPPSGVRLSPILDLLNVRYVIFRGTPPEAMHPVFQSNDYWVLVNSNALPRVFVPRSVQTATSDDQELAALASPEFNPADVAYVESAVELPARCLGTARITNETPTHITVSAQMETPGLVVLADNWDKGWRASWNGRPVPVLRTDYSVRGVVVPAGAGTLEFVYKPASFILGLWLAGFAAIVLLGWLVAVRIPLVKTQTPPGSGTAPVVVD